MSTPGTVLFGDMNPVYLEFWKDVKMLAFGEIPDYSTMRLRFEECWRSSGFGEGNEGNFDWWGLWERSKLS